MPIQGKILAVELGRTEMINTLYPHLQNGHRYMLAVQNILAKVQTTVFFGYNLYTVGALSNLDEGTIFANFVKSPYISGPRQWSQHRQISFMNSATYPVGQIAMLPPPLPPLATGTMTVLDGGYSPSQGFWIEFAGNYFLSCPIFKDWADEAMRDGPNYKGFRGSQNNPGH